MALQTPSAGQLRSRVQFQRLGDTTNVGGVVQGDFADLGTPRSAKLTPTTGGAEVISGRLQGEGGYDLWVRSDSLTRTVMVGDRVVDVRDPSRVYAIKFGPVDPDQRRAWLFFQLIGAGERG